jgi:hypothetical protein
MENKEKIAKQAKVLRMYLLDICNDIYFNHKSDYEMATEFREAKSQWCDLERMVEDTGILDIESEEK